MLAFQKANKLFKSYFKTNITFTTSLVTIFFFFSFIGILNHEVWRDEVQAWLIARDSSSISEMLKNMKYEGHPALWHSCLYLITRFTHNPLAMQFFHLIIATGIIYIFTKYSPFTRLQKILFSFGYFSFYEYNLISRNYSIGILFIFLFCKFFPIRKQSYLLLSILIAVLANTNAYGLIIAIALGITLIFELVIDKSLYKQLSPKKWNLIISIFILVAGIIIALIQIIPPPDSSYYTMPLKHKEIHTVTNSTPINIRHLTATIITIWRSYIPVPTFLDYNFWNTNILMESFAVLKICAFVISLGLLFFSVWLFIQKPVALCLYLSGTFGILIFTYEKYFGNIRHHGHLFILFLACMWISNFYPKLNLSKRFGVFINFTNKHKNNCLTVILSIHVFVGVFAYGMDLLYPFSSSKEVTNFIQSRGLSNMLVAGSKGFEVSPFTALLDKKIYYPESDDFSSFVVWNKKYIKTLEPQEVLKRIAKLMEQKNMKKILLILNYELDAERPDLNISKILDSRRSIAPDETYHLYLVQKKFAAISS